MEPSTPQSIDQYIAQFPPDVQKILRKIRLTIRQAVPDGCETISYRMPCVKLHSPVVWFAAFKKHVGLYPPTRNNAVLIKAASRFAGPKGNLRFPLDQPIPYDLIKKIARHNARQNREKAAAKLKKR